MKKSNSAHWSQLPALAEVEVVAVEVVVVAGVEWEGRSRELAGDGFVRHGYGRVFGVGLGYELVEFGYESFGFSFGGVGAGLV